MLGLGTSVCVVWRVHVQALQSKFNLKFNFMILYTFMNAKDWRRLERERDDDDDDDDSERKKTH